MSTNLSIQHIIIFGNRKENTFGNTLRAIKKEWPNVPERHLHVFEVVDNATSDPSPNWQHIGRKIFSPYPFYHDVPIEQDAELPKSLAKILNELTINSNVTTANVFVDLTNGTKTWTELVYLTCTLMQIDNLFRVRVNREYFNTPYMDVPLNQIEIIKEPTLERGQLKELSRSVFSEYIFFLEEGYRFTEWLDNKSKLKIPVSSLRPDLRSLFVHFIQRNYGDCIVNIGKMLELILAHVITFLADYFRPNIWEQITNSKKVNIGLGGQAILLSEAGKTFEKCLPNAPHPPKEPTISYETAIQMIPMIPIGHYCVALSKMRNFSAHEGGHNHLLQKEIDARQMIHGLLYILGKLQECKIFE